MRKMWIAGGAAAALLAGFGSPAAAQVKVLGNCSPEALQTTVPADTVVVSAERLMKPVPHCKIEGFVTTVNPGPNRNYFRVQLPDKENWKGRFYFIGLGGSAGYVPTDSQFPPGNPIVKGFAVAGTDTGHQGDLLDWSFIDEPAKMLDHKHRGGHVVTVAAQQMTKAYYGVDKMWRYHSGCSGGGRMSGEAITYHPEDYDGVLLGERALGADRPVEFSNYRFIFNAQQMAREPGAWLSPAKLRMVDAKVTEACDMTDGTRDGIVWDHRLCKYDFRKIQCKGADGPDCLTRPEITSIRNILDGPRGADGQRLSLGWPITNMSTWSTFLGATPPPWSRNPSNAERDKTAAAYMIPYTMGTGVFGDDFDPMKFDLKNPSAVGRWEEASRKLGYTGLPDPTAFEKAGGKLLLFGGVSSTCCTNVEIMDWVDKYVKEMGPDRARRFMAFYQAPGVGHCSGGPGPQDGPDVVLQALMEWVENGKQPGGLVAHRGEDRVKLMFATDTGVPALPLELTGGKPMDRPLESDVSRDFLLCPYPQTPKSVFDKSKAKISGAVYDASNWSCK